MTRRALLASAPAGVAGGALFGLPPAGDGAASGVRGRPRVRTGLEVCLEHLPPDLGGRRVGLITNPSGVDAALHSTVDLLAARRDLRLVALFGPEHGIRGNAQEAVPDAVDDRTGLPVYSLYGATLSPTAPMLDGLDVLVFDIQDVGVRFYTYLSTLGIAMQAAAARGLRFVVLDRPNPLGGQMVDGPVLDDRFSSFLGLYAVPAIHGMTLGELARFVNVEYGVGADLSVVPMEGWRRAMRFDETGLPWVMTSPAIPHFHTALLYAALGPVGDTSLSNGSRTAKPFEFAGAPYADPWRLRLALEDGYHGGVAFREAYWREGRAGCPGAGTESAGVEVRVIDRAAYRPMDLMLRILEVAQRLYPARLTWDVGRDGRYVFDLELGTDRVRLAVAAGASVQQIRREWQPALDRFLEVRRRYLLYE
jgi:uncharacterized protein YbbC (DUF1343 family)